MRWNKPEAAAVPYNVLQPPALFYRYSFNRGISRSLPGTDADSPFIPNQAFSDTDAEE